MNDRLLKAAIAVVMMFPVLAFAEQECYKYDAKSARTPFWEGYGVPWNVLSPEKELLIRVTCTDSPNVNIHVGTGSGSQYIYERGYIANQQDNTWEPFKFDGKSYTGGFYVGEASKTIPLADRHIRDGVGYVISYVCIWTGTEWKCGCRDDASCDDTGLWQLQSVHEPTREDKSPREGLPRVQLDFEKTPILEKQEFGIQGGSCALMFARKG